jgi:hypothetical protein
LRPSVIIDTAEGAVAEEVDHPVTSPYTVGPRSLVVIRYRAAAESPTHPQTPGEASGRHAAKDGKKP